MISFASVPLDNLSSSETARKSSVSAERPLCHIFWWTWYPHWAHRPGAFDADIYHIYHSAFCTAECLTLHSQTELFKNIITDGGSTATKGMDWNYKASPPRAPLRTAYKPFWNKKEYFGGRCFFIWLKLIFFIMRLQQMFWAGGHSSSPSFSTSASPCSRASKWGNCTCIWCHCEGNIKRSMSKDNKQHQQ